ncbi:hypothetical protein X801_03225, partial [Opisthorchis viverrini]
MDQGIVRTYKSSCITSLMHSIFPLIKQVKSFRIFSHRNWRSNEPRSATSSSNEASCLCQFGLCAPVEKRDNYVRGISLTDNRVGDRTKKDESSQKDEKTSKSVKVSGKF